MKNSLLLRMYKKMLTIRMFEEKLNSLFLQGQIPGTLHLYNGQEACAVGVCENLSRQRLDSKHSQTSWSCYC